jgi:formylglycine-generating enzyme required for sulfatase activity
VTNANYHKCVQSKNCKDPVYSSTVNTHYYDAQFANHPVVYVSWFNANAYCKWVGGSLPSEAQWEKAARGSDGRLYPWGNTEPTSLLLNFNNDIGSTTEVGSYPAGASPYGLLDMAGNVRQWIADWYSGTYYSKVRNNNPTGPEIGTNRVLKGGNWSDPVVRVGSSARFEHDPKSPGNDRGFRCVR